MNITGTFNGTPLSVAAVKQIVNFVDQSVGIALVIGRYSFDILLKKKGLYYRGVGEEIGDTYAHAPCSLCRNTANDYALSVIKLILEHVLRCGQVCSKMPQ